MTLALTPFPAATGTLPDIATQTERAWEWAATPGHPDGRLGLLTVRFRKAGRKAGRGTQSDTYALFDRGPLPGLMGRRYWLAWLAADGATVEKPVSRRRDGRPRAYSVVLGPLESCTCAAGEYRPRARCRHAEALRALAAAGLVPGPLPAA